MPYKLFKEIIGAVFDGTDGEPPLNDTTSSVGVDNAVGGFKNDPGDGNLSGNFSNNPVIVSCNLFSSMSTVPPKRSSAFETIS